MSRRSYGTGNITSYQTTAGTRWSICYRVPKPTGGTTQKRESGHKTRAAAEKRLRKVLAELDDGRYLAPSQITFAEHAERWLDGLDLQPATVASYRKNLRLHVLPTLGAVPLQQLHVAQLEALYAALRTGSDGKPALSRTTVRYIHVIIGACLQKAKKHKLITVNPQREAEPPNKPDAKELTVWTPERARQFLTATETDRFGPLWRLLLMTGARRGEALAQTWESLDLDAATMRISRSMSDTEWGQPVFVIPKTASSRRTVSLDAATVAVLRKHRARQQAERLAFGGDYPDHGLVFVWEDGTVPHVDYVTRLFRETQQKLGWEPIRLHDLRHCHASLLLANGQPVKVVQERLGHATPSITLQVYTHTLAGQDQAAADLLASLIA